MCSYGEFLSVWVSTACFYCLDKVKNITYPCSKTQFAGVQVAECLHSEIVKHLELVSQATCSEIS